MHNLINYSISDHCTESEQKFINKVFSLVKWCVIIDLMNDILTNLCPRKLILRNVPT